MKRTEISEYIVIDPEICHGQITFRDTRIPIDTILGLLAKGYSVEQLLKSYPELTHPAIEQAIELATESLRLRFHRSLEVAA